MLSLLWRVLPRITCLLVAACTVTAATAADQPAAELDPDHAAKMERGLSLFERHVRPLLLKQCLRCHGGEHTESDFSLVTRDGLLKGGSGGRVLVPGDAEASRLMRLVRHEEEPHMPMDAPRLADEELAHLAEWINNLAPYDQPLAEGEASDDWTARQIPPQAREFWSFRPLADARPPERPGDRWSRTAVDRFLLAELQRNGLAPSAAAPRRALIRRAYLDLLGLPPSWEQVEAFVNDPAPDAWERLVDVLLASPHYGERWGRHWLDLARFAESHGFEHDTDRHGAYHYRDFVIQALNEGMPYDRFVQYQLAGDELAPQDRLALMATGFLAAGVHSTQITINEAERHRYDEMDDMLSTACTTFLGLTVGCARCHDHKYDPIPSADYYRLLATFTTTVRSEVEINFDPERYSREKDAYDAAHAPLVAALVQYEQGALRCAYEAWATQQRPLEPLPPWIILDEVTARSGGGATFEKLPDGSLLVSGPHPLRDSFTLQAVVDLRTLTGLRLEALADPSLPQGGPGRADNGNFALSDLSLSYRAAGSDGAFAPLTLTDASATFEQTSPHLPVAAAIDVDPLSAWGVEGAVGRDHAATFQFAEPLTADGPLELTIRLQFSANVHHAIGRLRIAVTSDERPALHAAEVPHSVLSRVRSIEGQPTPEQSAALFELFRQSDAEWRRLRAAVRAHEVTVPRPAVHKVLIASEGLAPLTLNTQSPREFFDETYFLKRGDVQQKVAVAPPGFLQVVSLAEEPSAGSGETLAATSGDPIDHARLPWSPPENWQTSGRRSELARWMTDVEHGAGRLLARVIVNRLWQHHFGEGIVRTPSDFGKQGELPTHPELLDWLARQLIAHEWDLKPIHQLLMTSAAYQQAAEADPARAAIDPQNRWLWRFARRRLEAEVVRDLLLASSGRLDDALYGPGTLNPAMTRRSIYFTIKRSELVPAMLVFDAPDALGGVGQRPSTTVAPQALYLMNNQQVRECAAAAAARVGDAEDPVAAAFRLIAGRDPDSNEYQSGAAFLNRQAAIHSASDGDAPRRALTDFCQVLLSLNEVVYLQ